MDILGYYKDGDSDLSFRTVFIAIDEGNENLTYYAPVGQHVEGGRSYLNECTEITKEEYLEASEGFYTPSDYL